MRTAFDSEHILLVLTVVYCLTLYVSYQNLGFAELTHAVPKGEEMAVEDRNERSSPRSFILPATPAIAFEQELAKDTKDEEKNKCIATLHSLGYDIGRRDITGNARLVASIYKYQKKNNIEANGMLDTVTRDTLGCSE